MFTLAQYVFGIGKHEIIDAEENSPTPNDTATYENDNSNQCVQTNIENDWILIEIEQHKSKSIAKNEAKKIICSRKLKPKSKTPNNVSPQEESWFVDPPECFKNTSSDSLGVKTSSIENLLIEHPSMSVFDNLFTKQVAPPKVDQLKKANLKSPTCKKTENCKENSLTVRPTKKNPSKKSFEALSANVLTLSNQNTAFTAVAQSGEAFNKKKCITKKNYDRKNKVAIQRNGPIIRNKKMFTYLNGAYHNRQHC